MVGATLGECFKAYETVSNPVTRSVYREIVANRLDRIEKQSEHDKLNGSVRNGKKNIS